MSMTNATAGGGGVDAHGGSTGGAGRAGAMAGESGGSPLGGRGAQAGGADGAGESGAATGGQVGLGGQGVGGQTGVSGSGPRGGSGACVPLEAGARSISFGTLLDADAVVCEARKLATSLSTPTASGWRAKGDQHRKYHFADANADEPYRLYVPTNWDGTAELPLAMFLHGSGSNENTYVDQNNAQMLKLAEEHGYLLVAPLGASGAYGNFL